ncbi:ferredoxin-like protein Fd1 [Cryptosporidium ryanae]|uniref:ferredoxin-like protein Fd1 n=1 Tax=Cryptosporidium ryanae TaxID=515981 RepID=UPI00351A7CCE|nr:ferredoxin-like protein Fd1 [Cryptosporidium ryanae]
MYELIKRSVNCVSLQKYVLSSLKCSLWRSYFYLPRRFHHSDPELWESNNCKKIDGEKKVISSPKGVSLLEAAQHEDLDIEGACEASLACSTCHVILDKEIYDKLDPPTEREEDMLDMAPQVCETSRLACQLKVDEKLTHGSIKLPMITRNFYVDGFKPSPH